MFDVSNFQLNDDVALITGAGAGIGRAIALTFAGAGASVMVSDLDLAAAEAVVAQITDAGGRAVARSCDVTDEDDLTAIVDGTVAEFGKLPCWSAMQVVGDPSPSICRWPIFDAPSI